MSRGGGMRCAAPAGRRVRTEEHAGTGLEQGAHHLTCPLARHGPVLQLLGVAALPQILGVTVGLVLSATGATGLLFPGAQPELAQTRPHAGVVLACLALAAAGLAVRLPLGGQVPAWQVPLWQLIACAVAYLVVVAAADRQLLAVGRGPLRRGSSR